MGSPREAGWEARFLWWRKLGVMCSSRKKSIPSPSKVIGNFYGEGDPQNFRSEVQSQTGIYWGKGVQNNKPSVGEVWISRTAHGKFLLQRYITCCNRKRGNHNNREKKWVFICEAIQVRTYQWRRRACKKADNPSMISRIATVSTEKQQQRSVTFAKVAYFLPIVKLMAKFCQICHFRC